jgi:tetratricopeptide (TPR) repeat protein
MASHPVHRVLLASGTLCGAALVETLLGGAGGGAVIGAALGGVGSNFLHQLADSFAGRLSRPGGISTDFLHNEDLERLVGRAIGAQLRGLTSDLRSSESVRARLEVLAARAEQGWMVLAGQPDLSGLDATGVTRLFASRYDEFATATALDAGTWAAFLESLDDSVARGGVAQQIFKALETSLTGLGSKALTAEERLEVGVVLSQRIPAALVTAARQAFSENDPAYAALQLRMMGELMADVRDIAGIVTRTDATVAALVREVGRLAEATRLRAPSVLAAAPDREREGLTQVLGEIERSREEIVSRLSNLEAAVAAVHVDTAALRRDTATIIQSLRLTWADITLKPLSASLPQHHVERPELIEELRQRLTRTLKPGVRPTVAVWGHGGEGKTTLALHFAHAAVGGAFGEGLRFPGGAYLVQLADDVSDPAGELRRSLAGLLQDLPAYEGLDVDKRASLVMGKLSQAPASLLLIDNVRDEAQWSNPAFQQWLPGAPCHVVATTRAERLAGVPVQRVGQLSFDQTKSIFESLRADAAEPGNEAALRVVHQELGGLALAVTVAAAYMQLEPGKTWQEEAEWLREAPTTDFHDRADAVRAASGYGGKTLAVLDALRARLPQAERLALDFAAHLPEDHVPAGWLEDLLDAANTDDNGPLHVTFGSRPSGDAQTAAGIVLHLQSLGLLTPTRDVLEAYARAGTAERRRATILSVHRLNARRAREASEVDGLAEVFQETVVAFASARAVRLSASPSDDVPGSDDHRERWISHGTRWELDVLLEVAFRNRFFAHSTVPQLLSSTASVLQALGRAVDAEPLSRDALAMRQRLIRGDHPDVAESLNNLAFVLQRLGRAEEAEVLYRDALAMQRRLFSGDHPDLATSLNNLAVVLWAMGRPEDAEPLHRDALAMRRRLFRGDHPDVARSLNNCALVLEAVGRAGDAEPLHRDALAMRLRLFQSDHPDVAGSLNNLATVLRAMGRAGEAEPLHRDALAMRQRLFRGDHPDVASSFNNLAFVLEILGRAGEAELLFRDALAMLRRLFRGDHPHVATSLNNVAGVLQALGRAEDAEPLCREALAMRQRLFRGDHPDVAGSLNNLAGVLKALERVREAERLYRDALAMRQRLFRSDHPQVATTLNNLAVVLWELGRSGDAEPLCRDALGMRQRLFRGDHPDVATSLNCLAGVLRALSRVAEAEPLYRDALVMRRRLFGGDHPQVATSLSNLANVLEALGQAGEAEPLHREAHEMRERLSPK